MDNPLIVKPWMLSSAATTTTKNGMITWNLLHCLHKSEFTNKG